MNLYIISGLGADFKVLEKLEFPPQYQIKFIDWLIPQPNESFDSYIHRMAEKIDTTKEFCLLGYSFGGILAQEIHQRFPAQKVIILGSIQSHHEKSKLIKFGYYSRIPKLIPEKFFNEKNFNIYAKLRHLIDTKNPKILAYFTVRNSYYLKWSIEQIANWKHDKSPDIIQIMGDKDIVFPIRNSHPDYIIKGGTHLFPLTKAKEVSKILQKIL
ncbi:MAG: alpha/beta hydrolase [Bacteroidetes bacterium]|nr:alpha/beta hydrolase [Bacteroidota bacterium]